MTAGDSTGDGLGIISLTVMASGYIMEYFTLANVNDLIVTLSGLGGLVFLGIKIRGGLLDNKKKSKDLEKEN